MWEDDRNAGDWDIYAQMLSPWETVTGIAEARSQPVGAPISLPARIVTGSFDGCFYVQEADCFAGIRVEYPQYITPGTLVSVLGTLEFCLEPYISASVVRLFGTDDLPGAIGITASRLGGASISELSGLTNVGLLIRTWGRVVSKPTLEQPYMVITDGTREVRVYCTSDVEVDDTVAVTGICSGEDTSNKPVVIILTRDTSDIERVIQ